MEREHITQLDFVYVIGDAYVDHPSFGHAIISRILQLHGYTVGIISQPDWQDKDSISILGEPRLGFLVTAGNMDSMVNHYSVSKHRRNMDSFTPGGVMGKRPDYATIVYCNLIRQTYKHTPILIGGIEASLRRLGTLRLLVGQGETFDPFGFRCGSYHVRHGRTQSIVRDRGSSGQRTCGQRHYLY